MEYTFEEDQIATVAASVIANVTGKILCLYGPMGAGKTTLIKALVRELGGAQRGSSPTFGIVNEYSKDDGSLLGYHFDFYRIEDETEALDLGLEEYLQKDVWIFMEWPEKIATFIPEDAIMLNISVLGPKKRKINVD